MNFFQAFEISASGMAVEKTRLDAIAANLANVNSSRGADGAGFKPLRVVSGERIGAAFDAALGSSQAALRGAQVYEVAHVDVPDRMVYEPGHPDADQRGFVAYPGISTVTEMVNLISTVRAYEANVAAMSATKSMAEKALDMGGGR
jgi:flagellar basal-body rod protein FlgC